MTHAENVARRIRHAQERYDEDTWLARVIGIRPRRRTLAELFWGVAKR